MSDFITGLLGVEERSDEAPRAGTETSFNVIESLSAVIGVHLHRPTEIPKVAGVSSDVGRDG